MYFGENDVRALVESVWATLLGLPVRPSIRSLEFDGEDVVLTGCVAITGSWEGAVTLHCPLALARRAAAILFDTEPEVVSTEHVHDALGELTNIIGGNLKALLPAPSYLSLPAVADGRHYAFHILDSRPVVEVAFRCQELPFQVVVLVSDLATAGLQNNRAEMPGRFTASRK